MNLESFLKKTIEVILMSFLWHESTPGAHEEEEAISQGVRQ
jgi:hypothetical protein